MEEAVDYEQGAPVDRQLEHEWASGPGGSTTIPRRRSALTSTHNETSFHPGLDGVT